MTYRPARTYLLKKKVIIVPQLKQYFTTTHYIHTKYTIFIITYFFIISLVKLNYFIYNIKNAFDFKFSLTI